MGLGVRTKDADCLLSPRVEAIHSGVNIAERLLDAGWKFKATSSHPAPGTVGMASERTLGLELLSQAVSRKTGVCLLRGVSRSPIRLVDKTCGPC